MPQSRTTRGFAVYAEFEHMPYYPSRTDSDGLFSVQESSLATERKVWVGLGNDRAQLSETEARIVRDALNEFLKEASDVEA
jgi:hypothetical protein